MNDPTQFEQVDETCEFGGAVLYSESLGITAFFENVVPSKYETQKLKQLQFGIENEKIRQFDEYSARDCAPQPLKLSIHSGGIEHPCRCR